ncbi:MAG: N-acetylmuramoyl-L-alanine amidase [Bryobacterales bacterium]|nr:N-acetylmuramoyl-L-alanine amidase [Bryobacterales bacterium]
MAAVAGSSGRPMGRPLLAALFSLQVCAGAGDHLAVTAVRYWSLSDVTRIAVETNGSFRYRTDKLYDPNRVFYDLMDARPQLSSKGVHTIAINDPRVKQIRVAETQPAVTRVVLDLEEGQFDISASQLTVPDRLVIEVRAKGDIPSKPTLSSNGVRRIEEKAERSQWNEPPVLDAKPEPAKPAPILMATPALKPPPEPVKAAPRVYSEKPAEKPSPGSFLSSAPALPDAPPLPVNLEPVAPPAAPAKRNSNGDRSLTRALGLKIRRVVLDPGHGGHDHGSTGPGGLAEKDLVLDVARRLGALIEENMGSEVIYTRSNDRFIALEERTAIANAKKADIFLSIHANSSPIKSVSGVETYYLSFTTSKAAMDLAARENALSERSISDLKDLLQKIAQRDKADESREFAAKVQGSLIRLTGSSSKANRDRGVKKAPFVVLIGASMPSVLAEIGFVSNSREEAQLKKGEYRQKLAEALFKGLEDYAQTLSHFEVAQRKAGARH